MRRSDARCQSGHVLRSRAPARARCVYEQTLQARSLVCPGRVPGAHTHLAHVLGALWPPASSLARGQKQFSPSVALFSGKSTEGCRTAPAERAAKRRLQVGELPPKISLHQPLIYFSIVIEGPLQ